MRGQNFGWQSDSNYNDFSSKNSSSSKPNHNLSSMNVSLSSNTRNPLQFGGQVQNSATFTNSSVKNMTSSQVSESQTEESFKGNIYFMKFEQFLKEFSSVYMLKVYQRPEQEEEEEIEAESAMFSLESRRFRSRRANQWKCYVFESFWKGKRLGGPKVNLEKMYVTNFKSRFKKGRK